MTTAQFLDTLDLDTETKAAFQRHIEQAFAGSVDEWLRQQVIAAAQAQGSQAVRPQAQDAHEYVMKTRLPVIERLGRA